MELKIQNLSKKYNSNTILQEINLEIQSGSVFGIVGPNGAGKSTLIKILSTLIKPTTGRVLYDEFDIHNKPNLFKRFLGYLPQDVGVYPNLTAFEFLEYIASLKSLKPDDAKKQICILLDMFNLNEYNKLNLSKYSGGMRQRVGIISALLGDPKVIIADEPSVGLDPEERIHLRTLLCDLAKSRIVLLSTHIISDVENTATQLAVLKKGKLIFTGNRSVFTKDTGGNMESAYLNYINKE